ncbi:MAG: hypothetical protein ACRD1Y_00415, partial [Terriglobales bacterium]
MVPAQGQELAAWLPQQRWYGAKSAAITGVSIADRCAELALVDVAAEGLPVARYALPELTGEGLAGEAVRARWFRLLGASAELGGPHGRFRFEALQRLGASASSRLLGAEQSNTSVLYGDERGAARWLLKLFRRVQEGENPDFEIPRALAQHTAFRNVPAVSGRLLYEAEGRAAATLAVAQEFVPNQGDGWEYVLRQLRSGAGEALLPEMGQLGRRTAEMHCALALIAEPDFRPEPITA